MKNTPDRIMDVAQKMILHEGFHGVSVDRIIEAASVSKGTFFYHFKSKDSLAVLLLQRFLGEMGHYIEALIFEARTQAQAPDDILLYFLEHFPTKFYEHTGSHGCLLNAFAFQLAQEIPEVHEICAQALNGWTAQFTPMLDAALRHNEVSPSKAEALSLMMFCLMEGAVIRDRISETKELEQQYALFVDYLRLLMNKPR